jgi:hypothetical protein|tara:strand:+ start:118 stop:453 length:336 start_codon:yes stop_codon:yes gene_type:complete
MIKKIILTVTLTLLSTVAFAQKSDAQVDANVNGYITMIEGKIELSADEREKLYAVKSVHTRGYWAAAMEFSDAPDSLADARSANNKMFNRSLKEAFGNQRAREIAVASQRK